MVYALYYIPSMKHIVLAILIISPVSAFSSQKVIRFKCTQTALFDHIYIVPAQGFRGNWGSNLAPRGDFWTGFPVTIDVKQGRLYHIKVEDFRGKGCVVKNVELARYDILNFKYYRRENVYEIHTPGLGEWHKNSAGIIYSTSEDTLPPLHSKDDIFYKWHNRIYDTQDALLSRKPVYFLEKPAHGEALFDWGEINEYSLSVGKESINLVRWLAGFPGNIDTDPELNRISQMVSVIQYIRRNTDISSYWDYSPARQYYLEYLQAKPHCMFVNNCGTDNLYGATAYFMRDIHSPYTVSHRLTILDPRLERIGWGFYDNGSTLYVANSGTPGASTQKALCWPAPGFFPNEIFNGIQTWSVSLNPEYYQKPAHEKVRVKLTFLYNNKEIILDHTTHTRGYCGTDFDPLFHVENHGPGFGNVITFRPGSKDAIYADGAVWKVEITGLKDIKGRPASLSYHVEFVAMD